MWNAVPGLIFTYYVAYNIDTASAPIPKLIQIIEFDSINLKTPVWLTTNYNKILFYKIYYFRKC